MVCPRSREPPEYETYIIIMYIYIYIYIHVIWDRSNLRSDMGLFDRGYCNRFFFRQNMMMIPWNWGCPTFRQTHHIFSQNQGRYLLICVLLLALYLKLTEQVLHRV